LFSDFYGIAPKFKSGGFSIQPFLVYLTSDDYSSFADPTPYTDVKDLDIYYLGVDLSGKVGPVALDVTLISQSGDVTQKSTLTEHDVKAFLGDVKATVKFGSGDIHAEVLYASGDDNDADTDLETFLVPSIQSYTWAEIWTGAMFDFDTPDAACGRDTTNLMAYNVGLNFKPMKKVNVALDVWKISLAENDANGYDDLGTEVDLIITYELLKNLNLDLVGCYLWTGDATYHGDNQKDMSEIGAQLSFKF